jgi:hypothetical protein
MRVLQRRCHPSSWITVKRSSQRNLQVNHKYKTKKITDSVNNFIRKLIFSESRITSSSVSTYKSVIVFSSHKMGTVAGIGPHSSIAAPLSSGLGSNQHAVAMAPSDTVSKRNLFKRVDSGRESGGMKSTGKRMKSWWICEEKCRRSAQVPALRSGDWSYGWMSMVREE